MWKKKQIVRKNKEERKKSQERNKLGGIPPNLMKNENKTHMGFIIWGHSGFAIYKNYCDLSSWNDFMTEECQSQFIHVFSLPLGTDAWQQLVIPVLLFHGLITLPVKCWYVQVWDFM